MSARSHGSGRRSGASDGGRAVRAEDYPAFRDFLRGYLHQDFEAEYGSVGGAVRAWMADATAEDRARLAAELEQFDVHAKALSLSALRRFLADELGCAWVPGARTDLAAVVTAVRDCG